MKEHLKHTANGGPTCQRGRVGGSLRGEHFVAPYSEFRQLPAARRCARCSSSSLFAFLTKQADKEEREAAEKWEAEDPDAWKRADDALVAARRLS